MLSAALSTKICAEAAPASDAITQVAAEREVEPRAGGHAVHRWRWSACAMLVQRGAALPARRRASVLEPTTRAARHVPGVGEVGAGAEALARRR